MSGQPAGWSPSAARRYPRRRLMRLAGVTLAGTAMLACGRSKPPGTGTTATTSGGRGGPSEAPRPGGTLREMGGAGAELDYILDPQRVTVAGPLGSTIFSRLFRYQSGPDPQVNMNQELENDLALSAESPDAVTWTVKLRPDARFHKVAPVNGHAVEAEDVKATYSRALALSDNPHRGDITMIDAAHIETPDSRTVVFKLNYPYAGFQDIVASPLYGWILPREAATDVYDPAKQAIGSGPFLIDSITPDVANVFRRNPDWFEKGRPYIDSLYNAVIVDSGPAMAQFLGGNLDVFTPDENDLDTVKKQKPNAQFVSGFGIGGGYFGLRPSSREMPYQATKAAIMALSFYLGDELRDDGVAVNAVMPGHTRASWFDATARAWQEQGQVYGGRPVVSEHMIPISLFLAAQDGRGVTGMLYSVPDWNYAHGYGNYAAWQDRSLPPDLEELYRKAEAGRLTGRGGMGLSTPAMRP